MIENKVLQEKEARYLLGKRLIMTIDISQIRKRILHKNRLSYVLYQEMSCWLIIQTYVTSAWLR